MQNRSWVSLGQYCVMPVVLPDALPNLELLDAAGKVIWQAP
jgi:hypothetical protein